MWGKHRVPPDARRGLIPFIRSLNLPELNTLRYEQCGYGQRGVKVRPMLLWGYAPHREGAVNMRGSSPIAKITPTRCRKYE